MPYCPYMEKTAFNANYVLSKYQSLVIFLKKKTNFLVYLHFVSYVCIKIENKDKNDTESKI